MDLPPELRIIIYTFALNPNAKELRDGPQLTAGLSESMTALALSQVCRIVRQESMKAYYSETTFVVRDLPNHWANFIHSIAADISNERASPPSPDPLDLWAQTWGVHGAEHIRSLYISLLEGSVRISMADKANPLSFDEAACANISASALESAGSTAFGWSSQGMTAGRKIEKFLHEVGKNWHVARRREALPRYLKARMNRYVNAICRD